MADTDLKVIVKSKELLKHTYTLTANVNRYPKKYRHSLVDRMQLISMDIFEFLLEANRINNKTDKRSRCETITRAITGCDKLQTYIELSMELNILSAESAEYWSKMVSELVKKNCEMKRLTFSIAKMQRLSDYRRLQILNVNDVYREQ